MDQNYTLFPDLPYVLDAYVVPTGKTFTLQPGVVMKFQQKGGLYIAGNLQAEGSADRPIVFTSLHDDECGISGGCGDTDHASTTPAAGNWFALLFNPSSGPSSLAHITVRFGGNGGVWQNPGAIRISSDASVNISHATIEKNYYTGMRIEHASPHISDSLIQEHKDTGGGQSYGLFLTSSSTPVIANTHFKNNDVHIYTTDTTSSYIDGGGNVME